jgi:hypothetical protein
MNMALIQPATANQFSAIADFNVEAYREYASHLTVVQ